MKKINTSGFTHIETLVMIIVVAVVVGIGAYLIVDKPHADTLSSTLPGNWTVTGEVKSSETTIMLYTCVNKKVSSTNWQVDGLAVMNPAVSDESAYEFETQAYNSSAQTIESASNSSWGTYVQPASSRNSIDINPSKTDDVQNIIESSKHTIWSISLPGVFSGGVQPQKIVNC